MFPEKLNLFFFLFFSFGVEHLAVNKILKKKVNDITLFSTPCSCPLVGYGNSWLFFSFPSLTKCM